MTVTTLFTKADFILWNRAYKRKPMTLTPSTIPCALTACCEDENALIIFTNKYSVSKNKNVKMANKTPAVNLFFIFVHLSISSLILLFLRHNCNNACPWVSAVLYTSASFSICSYKQLSKKHQNIRNLLPFWCKINSPQKNRTKQKRGGFPVVYFTTNTYTLKREILNFSNKTKPNLWLESYM